MIAKCGMKKDQITSTKFQINPKSQYPMTKTSLVRRRIDHLNLFVFCDLLFGISYNTTILADEI